MPGSRPAPQAGALAGVRAHPTQGAQTALPPTSFVCSWGRCEGLPGIPAMTVSGQVFENFTPVLGSQWYPQTPQRSSLGPGWGWGCSLGRPASQDLTLVPGKGRKSCQC